MRINKSLVINLDQFRHVIRNHVICHDPVVIKWMILFLTRMIPNPNKGVNGDLF